MSLRWRDERGQTVTSFCLFCKLQQIIRCSHFRRVARHPGILRNQRRWRRTLANRLHPQLHDFRTHLRLLGRPLLAEVDHGVRHHAVGRDDASRLVHESLRMVHRLSSVGRHRRSFLLNHRTDDSLGSLRARPEVEDAGRFLLRDSSRFRLGVSLTKSCLKSLIFN